MSKTLIYLFAVFGLWLYFKYGNFKKTDDGKVEKDVKSFDFKSFESQLPAFMRPGNVGGLKA